MLRFAWRLRRTRRYIRKILKFYKYFSFFKGSGFNNKYITTLFTTIHLQSIPTRQHYFTFSDISSCKSLNFSSGYILSILGYKIKYFKRSYTSAATIVLFFRHYYLRLFTNIYLYRFKNINYRQIYYFQKLTNSIKLNIYYLIHRKSYIPRFFPPRRIKRRVLHLIGKQ